MRGRKRRTGAPSNKRYPNPFPTSTAYIGYLLPTSVANGLLELQRRLAGRLAGGGAEIHWVRPAALHLTIRYLGGIHPPLVDYLKDSLERLCADRHSFPLRLGPLQLVPGPGEPKALWTPVEFEEGTLEKLREDIDAEMTELGLSLPDYPFHPHVTLGQVVSLPEAEEFLQQAQVLRGVSGGRFWLSELQLFLEREKGSEPGYDLAARGLLQRPPVARQRQRPRRKQEPRGGEAPPRAKSPEEPPATPETQARNEQTKDNENREG